MKTLEKSWTQLEKAGRWDIDFHLPAEGITAFPKSLLKRVDAAADIAKDKRDPTLTPDELFQYIDIASVDVKTGLITNPQELLGEEAPSRARKVVRAYDIIVSTCRPTRGAIAVVPPELHNQMASTAFSILRAKDGVNPFYLCYALRLASTLEQFRKWSTGSSYPAILDDDVKKTLIPLPGVDEQEVVAAKMADALREREEAIQRANASWQETIEQMTTALAGKAVGTAPIDGSDVNLAAIAATLRDLPKLRVDEPRRRGKAKTSQDIELPLEKVAA